MLDFRAKAARMKPHRSSGVRSLFELKGERSDEQFRIAAVRKTEIAHGFL
jgi:hypothetical protein